MKHLYTLTAHSNLIWYLQKPCEDLEVHLHAAAPIRTGLSTRHEFMLLVTSHVEFAHSLVTQQANVELIWVAVRRTREGEFVAFSVEE
jgi:hypothetical protein